MAENLQTKFRNEIFWKKTVCILIKISQSVFLVAPLAIRQSMLWKEPRAEQATDQYTVKCRYNAVQYCKILNTLLQELRQNINQMRDLKKTPNTSPYRASYGMPFLSICEKNDRVITAQRCMKQWWPTSVNHMLCPALGLKEILPCRQLLCGVVITQSISSKILTIKGARYGVSVATLITDLLSVTVITVSHEILW